MIRIKKNKRIVFLLMALGAKEVKELTILVWIINRNNPYFFKLGNEFINDI